MTTLKLITPPTAEPVALDEMKLHLRVDHTDEDALILSYVRTARELGEGMARRAFVTQTLEMVIDEWPAKFVLGLLRPPLQSVTSVTYYDEDGVSAVWTDYVVNTRSEPGRIHFNSTPGTALMAQGGIVVRYVTGYGDTPDLVPWTFKQGILLTVAHWYENREAVNVGNIINEIPLGVQPLFKADRGWWWDL